MKLGKKKTGGRYIASRKKKKYELVRQSRVVKVGNTKKKNLKVRGKKKKLVLLSCQEANILDNKGKAKKAIIKSVIETNSNRFWARQNRLVKGAIIETNLGKAKITNRPSQEGCINAILLIEKE